MRKALYDPEILRLARANRGPYLAALCAPRAIRADLLALISFDTEIARIPRAVSDPMLGRIRLQWWIDALPEICRGNPPSHPVARALALLDLPLDALCALAQARNFDLQTEPASPQRKVAYGEATGGALHVLMLDIVGREVCAVEAPHCIKARRDVGAAWVLSGMKNKGVVDEDARVLALDLLERARHVPAQPPTLALARLSARRLKNPNAPMGVGAAVNVLWGRMTGRL